MSCVGGVHMGEHKTKNIFTTQYCLLFPEMHNLEKTIILGYSK